MRGGLEVAHRYPRYRACMRGLYVTAAAAGLATGAILYAIRARRVARDNGNNDDVGKDYDSDEEADREILERQSAMPPHMLSRRKSSQHYRGSTTESSSLMDVTEATGACAGVVPLSSAASLVTARAADEPRRLELAFLTWNINGTRLTEADALAWATLAGPADAYFVTIQELIDIVDKNITVEQREAMSDEQATAALAKKWRPRSCLHCRPTATHCYQT